jgi:hypothetical protein
MMALSLLAISAPFLILAALIAIRSWRHSIERKARDEVAAELRRAEQEAQRRAAAADRAAVSDSGWDRRVRDKYSRD